MPSHQTKHVAEPRQLGHLRFYGEDFLLDARTGSFFRLSSSALFILRQIAEGHSESELTHSLLTHYGIEQKLAVRDIELLTNELVTLGIFQPLSARAL